MQTLKQISSDTQELDELKGLMEVYEDLSASRMQKVRQLILSARDFYEALAQVSQQVGADFQSLQSDQKKTQVSAVFVAANSGLYGDIIDRTFRQFLEYIRNNPTEVYVAGSLGESLMHSWAPEIEFQTLPLSDDQAAPGEFDQVLRQLLPHRQVLVFYGKFYNIAIQHPSQIQISGEMLPQGKDDRYIQERQLQYLYEPSLYEVSDTFAQEVMAGIMEQTLREAQLAKQASRLMQLDQAVESINEQLVGLLTQRRNLSKKISNKKQNLMVAGLLARQRL